MLRRVSISNYVLIDSLEIDFPDGLVIITGETGAGKSIILGAVSLLLGSRADLSLLGNPDKNCVVEAEFSVADTQEIRELFAGNDVQFDSELIIRRVIGPTGRSRAFLNDEPVTLQFLNSLSLYLVDIHSQHQHLKLSDPSFLMSVVDTFAACGDLLDSYQKVFRRYTELVREIDSLERKILENTRDREYRQYQYDLLSSANLRSGELGDLEEEQKELSCAEDIRAHLLSSFSRLENDDTSVLSLIKESVRDIEKSSSGLSHYSALAERLESCRIELDDILDDISRSADSVVVSPERLDQVNERLSQLWSLMGKFGCKTEDELIAFRDGLQATLNSDGSDSQRLAELQAEFAEVSSQMSLMSDRLHETRVQAVEGLSGELQALVRSLEMPKAHLEFVIQDSGKYTITGRDVLSLKFASSEGQKLSDISKTASGGELSRIMLCLKSMLADCVSMPTIVFDEIDTGVSGSVADKMGSMLSSMGRSIQVIAITHLPQVASKGSSHYKVTKTYTEDGKAVTSLTKLSDKLRIEEIARLLSGTSITDAAVNNARDLLGF